MRQSLGIALFFGQICFMPSLVSACLLDREVRRRRRASCREATPKCFISLTSGWRENAKLLGLAYPPTGGDEPTLIRGGLSGLWRDKPVTSITRDAILDLIEETQRSGIPGLQRRNRAASDSRGRHLSAALGTMFKWLSSKRRTGLATI